MSRSADHEQVNVRVQRAGRRCGADHLSALPTDSGRNLTSELFGVPPNRLEDHYCAKDASSMANRVCAAHARSAPRREGTLERL